MVCDLSFNVFLFVIFFIQASLAMSQPNVCQGPFGDDELVFYNMHNFVSSNVEPPAANMNLYCWDPELHQLAIKMAERCSRGTCVSVNSYNGSIGINTAYRQERPTADNGGVRSIVEEWASEKDDYDFGANSCDPRRTCFRYTQIVWAETKYLACAISSKRCKSGKYTAVCLYSPKGNIAGEKPYIAGPPCSECEPGRQNCVFQKTLCAP